MMAAAEAAEILRRIEVEFEDRLHAIDLTLLNCVILVLDELADQERAS